MPYPTTTEGYAGKSEPLTPPNPVSAVHSTFNRMTSVSDRILSLEAKLVGAVPTEAKGPVPAPSNGILGELHRAAEEADAVINKMHAALDRIENQLP